MRELRDILTSRARWGSESLVLGTVVDVSGSSYRQPGARMLLRASGDRVGLISGGCLERDVARRAFDLTANGPQTVLYDTRGDRFDPKGRYGSGCDGVVHLFLERLLPDGPPHPAIEALTDTIERRESCVLATLFEADSEWSDFIGHRATLPKNDGSLSTTLPEELRPVLRPIMQEATRWRRPRTLHLVVGDDQNRQASFLIEPLRPPLDLLIFGAGDDVRPLVSMTHTLGWDVRIADQWPALATRKRFPLARQTHCAPVEKLLDSLEVDQNTYALLMTHDFDADAFLLPALLEKEPAFIGLMGPRRRTMRLFEELHRRGVLPAPDALDGVQTPLGLDLGGESPAEVALSVMGGVLAARNERPGTLIQQGDAPIHDEHQRLIRRLEESP